MRGNVRHKGVKLYTSILLRIQTTNQRASVKPRISKAAWYTKPPDILHILKRRLFLCLSFYSHIRRSCREKKSARKGRYYVRSIRSPPARLPVDELRPLLLKPSLGASRSWTATLGT